MSDLSRFSVSVEEKLLVSFDHLIDQQGYANRSEAFRDLMRDALVKAQLENESETNDVLGTLTLVYEHHASDLNDKMNELQHDHYHLVITVTHVHINHNDCMEVILLRGAMPEVKTLANGLLSLKGVKHGHLFVTLPSQEIVKSKINSSHPSHSHKH